MTDLAPCLGTVVEHKFLAQLAFPKEGDAWWISEHSEIHASSAFVFADGAWIQVATGCLFRKPTTQESLEGSKKRRAHIDSVIASRMAQRIAEVEDERFLKETEARKGKNGGIS